MQCKTKTSKKRILKTVLTDFSRKEKDFSRKEKAIAKYTKIYIKTKWQGQHKTSKKPYFHCDPSTKAVEMQQ